MIVDNMMKCLFLMHMDQWDFVVDNHNIETLDIAKNQIKIRILIKKKIDLLDKDIDIDYAFVIVLIVYLT